MYTIIKSTEDKIVLISSNIQSIDTLFWDQMMYLARKRLLIQYLDNIIKTFTCINPSNYSTSSFIYFFYQRLSIKNKIKEFF